MTVSHQGAVWWLTCGGSQRVDRVFDPVLFLAPMMTAVSRPIPLLLPTTTGFWPSKTVVACGWSGPGLHAVR
jgi:hypothetical protein